MRPIPDPLLHTTFVSRCFLAWRSRLRKRRRGQQSQVSLYPLMEIDLHSLVTVPNPEPNPNLTRLNPNDPDPLLPVASSKVAVNLNTKPAQTDQKSGCGC